ncbi:MAG TPA: type II secretion system protein [Gemmatimonadaceae bacterium]|nr:type II secretion system protein [Gemmatimonadaceae bacterium]
MRNSPTRQHRSKTLQAGFTLAETMIVLVISGLMITLAIPRLDTSKYKADAVAQIVRTTLQNAQRNAITRQHDIVVSFDTTTERIRLIWDANNDGQATPGERVTYYGLENGILFTDPSVTGVSGTAIATPISGSNVAKLNGLPTVTFHRDGSVSSDAEIYISVPARGPKIYRAVTLTQATGRVDWYRLNTTTNKWVPGNL